MGIEREYSVPPPVEENVFDMGEDERDKRGIGTIPTTLGEAISLAESSELLRESLADHVFRVFVQNKKIEWDSYKSHVTDYEIQRYLPML